MSPLSQALGDYLAIRRQLGFELIGAERQLKSFVEFMEQNGAPRITTELALQWATLTRGAHPHWCRERLGAVRCFARYLATVDPQHEVPSVDLLPAAYQRLAPYLYPQEEIAALMDAAKALRPPLLAAGLGTVIGLMASTGIRTGEALGLDRQDVDLDGGALHIRAAKRRKQREVPLHDTTTEALREYARQRERHRPRPQTQAFFVCPPHLRRLTASVANKSFVKLLREVGLDGRGEHMRPRLHDLRHTFAVRTLIAWHRDGEVVDRKLPLLQTYMGHVDPASTYWYLQAAPELLALVGQRLDRALGGGS